VARLAAAAVHFRESYLLDFTHY